jgi:hypothetical protein
MRTSTEIREDIARLDSQLEDLRDELYYAVDKEGATVYTEQCKVEAKRERVALIEDTLANIDTEIMRYGFEGLGGDPDTLDDDVDEIWETFIADGRADPSDENHYYIVSTAAREYLEA